MESMPPTRRAKITVRNKHLLLTPKCRPSYDDRPLVTLGLEKSREREAQYHKVFSNHAIVAVVTAPTAELVEQAADRLTARLTARHGPLSVWFGIGKASGCGSIGWKRLATGMRVVVMRAHSPPPGALRAACPGGGLRPTSREAARP